MTHPSSRDRREEAPRPGPSLASRVPADVRRGKTDRELSRAAPPDLVALQLFCRIVETGSFSEAAEACYLSQSAVSQRMRALERHCGRVLLERGRGRTGAEPTEAGQAVYEGARQILERVQ